MRSNYLNINIHLVWATWDRQPIIYARRQSVIYQCIHNEAACWKVRVRAVGGTDNHVHVLVQLPSTVNIAHLVKQFKGKTSILCGKSFRWQGSYGALSVSAQHVSIVTDYIENQAGRHESGPLINSLETIE